MLASQQEILKAFDVQTLLQKAREESGLSDFNDEHLAFVLGKMQQCFAQDLQVDANGLRLSVNTTIRQLVNRLRFEVDLKKHPEILDEEVDDPIVILGFPRSGTTKTHRMMGVDPNLLKTTMWQLVNPAPFPEAIAGQPDPRIAAAYSQEQLLAANDANPALRAAHVYGANEVQEELWLFGLTFNYGDFVRPPSLAYQDYLRQRKTPSDLDNYRYQKSLIQYLQWQQGGRKNRRWLFKNTSNIGYMDELLQTFPRATLMHIHRNPMVSLPSVIRLVMEFLRTDNANIDPAFVTKLMVSKSTWLCQRYLESRDRLGLDERIIDIQYEQIRSNPMPAIRAAYERAGHVLTPESSQLMIDYEKENEQGKHGAHQYSLEQFGLTEAFISEQYGEYIKRYIR